jgi:PAS domain S-box-containing protein
MFSIELNTIYLWLNINIIPLNTINICPKAKEAVRLQALANYEILDTTSQEEFDRITRLAAIICKTPISLISFVDDGKQWLKSKVGLEIGQIPGHLAFCRHTMLQHQLFEVADATLDERFKNNPSVISGPEIRFYAGYPLTDPKGDKLGCICVIDNVPRNLDEDQKKALQLLAKMVVGLIVERKQKEEIRIFEQLFALSSDLLCWIGTDGYFKRANPALLKLVGLDQNQIRKNTLFDFMHPDDRAIAAENLKRIRTGENVVKFTFRGREKNGAYHYIHCTCSLDADRKHFFALSRDITSEVLKDKQLEESETRFQTVFEGSQSLVSTHDLQGNLLTLNPAGAAMLGFKPEEVAGKTLFDIFPPTEWERLKSYLEIIPIEGKRQNQLTFNLPDGRQRSILFNHFLHLSATGEKYVITNGTDITDRYLIEKALQKTKKMLEETSRIAGVGGWQVNLETKTLHWSAITKEIHGVPQDYQPTLDSAINFYREGESRRAINDAIERSSKYGSSWDLELQLTHAKGHTIWVRVMGAAEFENGICKRIYGTFQDIDEKKRAQLEKDKARAVLSAFVQHTPVAVAMVDHNMIYVTASNRWLSDFKLQEQFAIGRSYYELFPLLTDEAKARHQRILAGAVESCAEDTLILPGAAGLQYVAWEMRPWFQFDGTIGGMMICTQNITPLVQQREELNKAKLQAEAASTAKSEFLASMSHEIRTPLNGIIGFTDLILKSELSTTQQQYLGIVNQSANSLLSVINDILDFSKIEAGKLELNIEECDIFEVVTQAADILTYQVQQKGLEMLLHLAPDLPRFVKADGNRLKQVLLNLLANAAKFTEKGEIELKVVAIVHQPGAATLRFSVRDTGIGIRSDRQQKIFEAFAQEDGSTTKRYGGTGLGLTISNKLLAMMDSELQLQSTPGEGSIFFFDLHLPSVQGESIVFGSLERLKKVLIVDDNSKNREIICQMLCLKNIQCTQAKSGFEALQFLADGHRFDLVIIDYEMPYMDGIETITKIRDIFSVSKCELPIILLSSSPDNHKLMQEIDKLKINACLLKPIKAPELYQALSLLYQKETSTIEVEQTTEEIVDEPFVSIVIVEDNAINMLLATTIIKRLIPGAKLIQTVNGAEALAVCQRQMPTLILMDLQMPVMNGYEATTAIRQLEGGTQVPIIALTASNIQEEMEKCLAHGMNDFISKPFIEKSFSTVLFKWVSQQNK